MAPILPRPTTIVHNQSYITTTIHPDTPTPTTPSYTSSPLNPSTNTTNDSTPSHLSPQTVNIGTRKSHLARVQTDLVVAELRKHYPQHTYTVHAISTMGDKNQVTALHDFGAKSLWTYELEALLVDGTVDFIVHCLKDIPTHLPPSLVLGAILPREDPRDALILSPHLPANTTLATLPRGSIIGTSSVRRSAQLKRLHPHLEFESVRGNINTRLEKLDVEGSQYAAIILAAAGLLRIDKGERISAFLSSGDGEGHGNATGSGGENPETIDTVTSSVSTPQAQAQTEQEQGLQKPQTSTPAGTASSETARETQPQTRPQPSHRKSRYLHHQAPTSTKNQAEKPRWGMLYAVGQGALALEMREHDTRVAALIKPLHHEPTALSTLAERSLMRTLEGGCSVPIGVETSWLSDSTENGNGNGNGNGEGKEEGGTELKMLATVISLSGQTAACAQYTQTVTTEEDADEFGREVARRLIDDGAEEILRDINLDRDVINNEEGGA